MQVRQQTGGRFVSSPSLQNRFQRDFLFGNRSGVDRRFNLLGQIASGGNFVVLLVVIVFASGRRASVRRRVLLLLASSRSDFGGGPFSNFRTRVDISTPLLLLLFFFFFAADLGSSLKGPGLSAAFSFFVRVCVWRAICIERVFA